MRKAFTLLELIFVIVIIGLLASIAVPKFLGVETSASKAKAKSTISAVESGVENIHGMWIVDNNFNWNSSCDFNDTTGYPKTLDTDTDNLFSCILKKPVLSCNYLYNDSTKYTNCFEENETNTYKYYFTPTDYIAIRYYEENGSFECLDEGLGAKACKEILY